MAKILQNKPDYGSTVIHSLNKEKQHRMCSNNVLYTLPRAGLSVMHTAAVTPGLSAPAVLWPSIPSLLIYFLENSYSFPSWNAPFANTNLAPFPTSVPL